MRTTPPRSAALLALAALLAAPRRGAADPAPAVSIEPAWTGVTIKSPISVAAVPGADRVLVADRFGKVYALPKAGAKAAAATATEVLSIEETLAASLEDGGGLFAVAVAPDFATSRRF